MFQLICSQIFFNLFMAITIEAFLGKANVLNSPVQPYHVQSFRLLWQKYDPLATGFIRVEELNPLIYDIS